MIHLLDPRPDEPAAPGSSFEELDAHDAALAAEAASVVRSTR